jgi:hypothetical protein
VPPGSAQGGSSGVVLLEDLSDRQIFPADNWWNLDVSAAPLDPSSDALIDFISGRTPADTTRTQRPHPACGPTPYGMPYVAVSGSQALLPVTFTPYGSQSDPGAPGQPAGYPIPDEARLQPNYIEGGVAGGGNSGDCHLLIVDPTTGTC